MSKNKAEAKEKRTGPFFNVIREDYFGDPGKQVGAALTESEADHYIEGMAELSAAEKFSLKKAEI